MPKLSDIADNIQAGQYEPQQILIFGDAGTGKTALVATLLLEGYELFFVDTENGFGTLLSHVPREYQNKVDILRIRDTKDTPWAIETCTKLMSLKPQKVCIAHGKIGCLECTTKKAEFEVINFSEFAGNPKKVVVFDSLTQIVESAKSTASKGLAPDAKLEFDHWGKMGMYLSIFLAGVQQAPFHVVCTSHGQMIKGVDGIERMYPVGGTSNASRQTARYFGHVVYTEIKNKKFISASSAQHNPRIVAKSRADLAMESGKVSLGDLLKFAKIEGGGCNDLQEEVQEDGSTQTKVTTSPFAAKMAALKTAGTQTKV